MGGSGVKLSDRLQGINTNIDDLQSGVDAGSREALRIREVADTIDHRQRRDADVGTLVRHAKELQACLRDQRAALAELRASVAELRDDMVGSNGAVRPPPMTAADRRRR